MKKLIFAIATIVALGIGDQSQATVIVGNEATASGNCFPFGCALWAPEYQQVYAKSDFSGPITITGLTFYNTLGGASAGFNTGTYTISLSTTSKAVNGLDLFNLSNNIGANDTVVFSGLLPTGPIGASATITLSTPFTYDPASGLNLLLDVSSSLLKNSLAFGDKA